MSCFPCVKPFYCGGIEWGFRDVAGWEVGGGARWDSLPPESSGGLYGLGNVTKKKSVLKVLSGKMDEKFHKFQGLNSSLGQTRGAVT